MRVAAAFEMYRSNLEIARSEHARARGRWQPVCAAVREAFEVEDTSLIGSYARHTMSRPLRDVDILCVLAAGTGQVERYRTAHPGEVLAALCRELGLWYPRCELGIARRAVAVDFGAGGERMSLDVVPAFKRDGPGYEIPDLHLGYWISTDPTMHAKLATEKNLACDGQWKPLIKMIKAWNRYVGGPVRPPFLLEVLGLDLAPDAFVGFPTAVRAFFAAAAKAVTKDCPDPAGLGPVVNDNVVPEERAWAAGALKRAHAAASHAQDLEEEDRESEALAAWRDLFGPFFPTSLRASDTQGRV